MIPLPRKASILEYEIMCSSFLGWKVSAGLSLIGFFGKVRATDITKSLMAGKLLACLELHALKLCQSKQSFFKKIYHKV